MTFLHKWIHRVNAGYTAAFFLLALCYVLTIIISNRLSIQANAISNTDTTFIQLDDVLSNLKGAQAAWGQYILTNNHKSFEQYSSTHRTLDSLLNAAYQFSPLTSEQRRSLDTLNRLINYMLPSNQTTIDIYRLNNLRMMDSLRLVNQRYSVLMDSITTIVTSMQSSERTNTNDNKKTLMSLVRLIKLISYITIIMTLILVIYMLKIFNREYRAKRKANLTADDYRKQLEYRINELTQMNKEMARLKSLEKFSSMGRIAAMIAHEIKNPLTNINLATAQLADESTIEKSNTFIEIINRNSQKINMLVNNFLKATAFDELHVKNISINALIDEILREAQDRISLEGITVKRIYTKNISEVAVDMEKIKIAFQNIIFNAIDAMEANKGVLCVTTEAREKKCIITIVDNGTGMDESILSKIFEPYFTTKPIKGSGMGLAQAQNIILNHGGSIEAESVLSQGTSFIVTLKFTS